MTPQKMDFTGTPDDFVGMVRLFHDLGSIINTQTGQLATREEIAAKLMEHTNVDLGGYPDYKTLELYCNGNDFHEKINRLRERFRREN